MTNSVRETRRSIGMTQEALAKKAGISRPALSQIEKGSAYPALKTAQALAAALNSTVDTLFDMDGSGITEN